MKNRLYTAGVFLVLTIALSSPSISYGAGEPCDETKPSVENIYSQGWGIDARNTRFQPRSALSTDNLESLKLKWVYGLESNTPRSLPLVTEDTLYVGDAGRGVVALDRQTGCERWVSPHTGYIASALLMAVVKHEGTSRTLIIYNDRITGTYAIDAVTGEQVWHAQVDDEPIPWYSGTPLLVANTLYVPVASQEVGLAFNPFYGCCSTSGGMAALDAATGKKLWYVPTIEAPAEVTGSHWFFVQKRGPSGAPVWGAPSYDRATDTLYFGTGQNYSHPTTDTSNAIFALNGKTGERRWLEQYTPNDAYTAACNNLEWNHPNCPKPTGPDVDFGAPTMLLEAKDGTPLLVAGQKSAEVHALNRHTGERVWTTRLGRGGIIGGVHWGMAANEKLGLIYAPNSDKAIVGFPSPGEPQPGLYALDIDTGQIRWSYSRASRCEAEECKYGLSSAITAANDIVVSGSIDGYLEIYNAATGERVWHYDAWREFEAINGVETVGGAFDAHGPMLAGDQLIVTAGYGYVGRQRPGNALLVFGIDDHDD